MLSLSEPVSSSATRASSWSQAWCIKRKAPSKCLAHGKHSITSSYDYDCDYNPHISHLDTPSPVQLSPELAAINSLVSPLTRLGAQRRQWPWPTATPCPGSPTSLQHKPGECESCLDLEASLDSLSFLCWSSVPRGVAASLWWPQKACCRMLPGPPPPAGLRVQPPLGGAQEPHPREHRETSRHSRGGRGL